MCLRKIPDVGKMVKARIRNKLEPNTLCRCVGVGGGVCMFVYTHAIVVCHTACVHFARFSLTLLCVSREFRSMRTIRT